MSEFHFLRPNLLFFFIPFLSLFLILLRSKRSTALWSSICDKDLMPYILMGKSKRGYLALFSMGLTCALLIIGIAGPTWHQLELPLIKSQSGLVIALDLSHSMDAQDIKPSRLKRALFKISDLLRERKEGLTGLVVFSGDAFVVTPLTDDVKTIEAMLTALETSIMPSKGHRADLAVAKGAELLKQAGLAHGSILLITSELSKTELDTTGKLAKEEGINISVLGIGSDEKAPIPKSGGGFVTDDKGALIITTLARENLKSLAETAHGIFVTISADDSDVHALNDNLAMWHALEQEKRQDLSRNLWHDQGYLLVLIALPFAALFFRRGQLAFMLLFLPHTLQAFSWNDLWATSDQQASALFHQENFIEAEGLFQNPDWQAAANYKLGNFEKAADLYQNTQSIDGLYNYATAKAKQGDLQAALQAYKQVLERQSDHEDALYNQKLIEDWLKEQEQNQKDRQEQNQQQDSQSQDQQNNQQDQQKSQDQQPQEDSSQDKQADQKQNQQQSDQEAEQEKKPAQEEASNEGNSKNDNPSEPSKEESQQNDELKEDFARQIDKELEKQEEANGEQLVQAEKDPGEEQRNIDNRWLQRIEDDPAGLLRRKFLYQYKQKQKN